jgi:hypothetical protein
VSEANVVDLSVESSRCGGVLAALLTNIRRIGRGSRLVLVGFQSLERDLEEALRLLEGYGVIGVVDRDPWRIVIVKLR